MIKFLINFKKTYFYKVILSIFWIPIYELFWQYILNFDRKILYFKWIFKNKKIHNPHKKELKKNFCKLVLNDQDFKKLSKKIHSALDKNNGELSKKIDTKYFELKKHESKENITASGEKKFNINFYNYLSNDLRREIFKFSISNKMLSLATDYLKVFPFLAKVIVYKNYPTEFPQRGSMLWHKDDFGYKSLDLFLNISSVDDESGPLHAVKKNDSLGVYSKSIYEITNPVRGERGKLDNKYVNEIDNKDKFFKLSGQGNALLVDSFRVYHRGGHCKNKTRLMLRFSYQTKDCLRLYNTDADTEYLSIMNEDELQNYFVKKLVFFKSNKFNDKIRNLLIKLYRVLHYKKVDLFS